MICLWIGGEVLICSTGLSCVGAGVGGERIVVVVEGRGYVTTQPPNPSIIISVYIYHMIQTNVFMSGPDVETLWCETDVIE